jgi:hypothetical protein
VKANTQCLSFVAQRGAGKQAPRPAPQESSSLGPTTLAHPLAQPPPSLIVDEEAEEAVESMLAKSTLELPAPSVAAEPSLCTHASITEESVRRATSADVDRFLVFSVERGDISFQHALAAARAIDNEVRAFECVCVCVRVCVVCVCVCVCGLGHDLCSAHTAHAQLRHLVELIKRLGQSGLRGRVRVTYGLLAEHAQDVFNVRGCVRVCVCVCVCAGCVSACM